MNIFTSLKEYVKDGIKSVENNFDKLINHQFAEATMAFCALIIASDGVIEQQEKHRVSDVILKTDKFKTANQTKLIADFRIYCEKLEEDSDLGKINCLECIRKIKGKDCNQIISIGMIIAKSGSDFGDPEKQIIKEVCKELELNSIELVGF